MYFLLGLILSFVYYFSYFMAYNIYGGDIQTDLIALGIVQLMIVGNLILCIKWDYDELNNTKEV